MSQPTLSDVHVNKPLTNISVAYRQNAANFVADKVFPRVPVQYKSDLYFKFDKGDWLRSQMEARAPGTESAGTGWKMSTDSYTCETYALHKDIPDEVRENTQEPLDMDRNTTQFLTQQYLIHRDSLWQSTFFKTGVWFKDWTGNALASDYANNTIMKWDLPGSTPLQDVDQAMVEIEQKTGLRPNAMVIGPIAFSRLKNNDDVIQRVKYTQRGIITEEMMAGMFGVATFLVARAVSNTANEGATDSVGYVFGKSVLLLHVAPAPSLEMPSAGYIFEWQGIRGGIQGLRVKKIRIETKEVDRIEISTSYVMKVIATDCGLFMSGVVS